MLRPLRDRWRHPARPLPRPLPSLPRLPALALALALLLALPLALSAQERGAVPSTILAPSEITGATLHASGAQVTRSAAVPASAGLHSVKIGPLPAILDDSGVQADGPEHLRVLSVQIERTAATDQAPPEALALEAEIETLGVERARIDRRRAMAESRLRRYGSLEVTAPPRNPQEPQPISIAPERWEAFIELAATGMTRAHADLAAAHIELRVLDRQIRQLVEQLAKIAAPDRTAQVHALVVVQNTSGAAGSIDLTYAVPKALWYPSYTVRIDSDAGRLEVSCYGVVHQATGENWPAIPIALSTALPEAGASVPELTSHRIRRDRYADAAYGFAEEAEDADFAPREQARERGVRRGRVRREAARMGYESREIAKTSLAADPAPAPPARRVATRKVSRDRARPAASPTFFGVEVVDNAGERFLEEYEFTDQLRRFEAPDVVRADRVHSILDGCILPTPANARGFLRTMQSLRDEAVPSDGAPHRLLLGRIEIPFTEQRLVRAELVEHAFRRLRAPLGGDEPLLAGGAAVFLGDAYLGTSRVPTTAPGEEITLDLGVDERVKVNRRQEDSEEDVGVFSKSRRYHTTVVIELVNHHEEAVTIDVRERTPFTEERELSITLEDETRPSPGKVGDRNGLLDWRILVPAGGKREVTVRYRIDAPRDWQLSRWENEDRLEEEE